MRERERERETDRQRVRETDRQTEREIAAFRKETVHDGNFAETDSCSIFLATSKILGQDLTAEFKRLIVCVIRFCLSTCWFPKGLPTMILYVCLVSFSPPPNGTCPVSHCLVNFTTPHFAFDTEGR